MSSGGEAQAVLGRQYLMKHALANDSVTVNSIWVCHTTFFHCKTRSMLTSMPGRPASSVHGNSSAIYRRHTSCHHRVYPHLFCPPACDLLAANMAHVVCLGGCSPESRAFHGVRTQIWSSRYWLALHLAGGLCLAVFNCD